MGWTHTVGPTLLNDLHGGAFRFVINGLPINFGKNLSEQLGIPNANRSDPNSSGLSFIEVSNFASLGDSLWTPEFAVENIFQIADTLSWTRGKHLLKFGIDFRRQQRNFFQETSPRGWYSFDSSYSQDLVTGSGGNGLASISTVPEVLTLRTGLHSNTEDSPVGALAIESTEFRNLVILYRIHHSLPRAVSAV